MPPSAHKGSVSVKEQTQHSSQRLAFLTGTGPPPSSAKHADEPLVVSLQEAPPTKPSWHRRLLDLTRQHLVVILTVLLGVVLVAMYALSHSSATEILSQPAVPSLAPPTPSPSPSPQQVRVHVLGAVASPGVVRVAAGAIVEDALDAAGGLLPEAGPGELNLAAPVSDGQQIIVGTSEAPRGEMLPPSAAASSAGLVNLNTATIEQLQELPSVGPVTAKAIVAWRDENGGFKEVAQLKEVTGIGARTYERLAPLVTT